MLIYSCDHIKVDPLVNKLKGNQEFDVEELTDDPSSQLSDNVSKLHSEISHGSVLIDCSCPGVTHSTMHTAVKSCSQKDPGYPDSHRWQIIQLNNCDADAEIDPSWSKLYGHVDMMDYCTLDDDVVERVESKLIDYSQSRTRSIHSSENELNVSGKQHLLGGQHDEQRTVGASRQTNVQNDNGYNKLVEGVEGLVQEVDVLRSETAEQHKEVQDSLKGQTEQLESIAKQEEVISVSMKQQLLPGLKLRPVGASVQKATNIQVDDKQILEMVEGIAQGIESLTAQSASQRKELLTSVENNYEHAETIVNRLDAIGKELLTSVEDDEELTCPVCNQLYKNPKFLSCYHFYCEECLEKIWKQSGITCPECRKETAVPRKGVKDLPNNSFINRIMVHSYVYVMYAY